MKNKNKFLSLVSIISSMIITLACSPLCATTSDALPVMQSIPVSPYLSEHQRTVSQFINDLKSIQNRTFQLIQLGLDSPLKDASNFTRTINLVNNDATNLRRNILNYQTNLPTNSIEYRDVLLILNALNYSKNALFYLEEFSKATSDFERALLLQNFFKSRLESISALDIIESLIPEY